MNKYYTKEELSPAFVMKQSIPNFDYYYNLILIFSVLSFSFVMLFIPLGQYLQNVLILRLLEISYYIVMYKISDYLTIKQMSAT